MSYSNSVTDSYTGFQWCGAGLHLLTPEAQTPRGQCKACGTRLTRQRRRRQRSTADASYER